MRIQAQQLSIAKGLSEQCLPPSLLSKLHRGAQQLFEESESALRGKCTKDLPQTNVESVLGCLAFLTRVHRAEALIQDAIGSRSSDDIGLAIVKMRQAKAQYGKLHGVPATRFKQKYR